MSSDKKKHDDRRADAPRTGSVVPEDENLATWLHQFWHRDEFPARIEVHQMFGRNKLEFGQRIHYVDFKPNDKLDIERVVKLSNEIVAAAQNDCDCVERRQHYMISVIDTNRTAGPLVRRLGPLMPKRSYLVKPGDPGSRDDEDDGDDTLLNGKSLSLAYTREANDQTRWDKQRYDVVMGQLLTLQSNIIDRQQATVDNVTTKLMNFFERLQDAEDRRLDRDIRRSKEELKNAILRDLFRTARNLIPGLVSSAKEDGALETSVGQPAIGAGRKDHGPSPERALCDNILNDCEETKISVQLFGEWEERDGKIAPVADKPGIFAPAQFAVLVGVRDGVLPPSALDTLLPDSGDRKAVTPEQAAQALAVMSESVMVAFRDLLGMRERARAVATTKQQPTVVGVTQ